MMTDMRPLLRLQGMDSKIQEVEEQLAQTGIDPNLQAVVDTTRQHLAETEETLRTRSVIQKNLELDLATKESQKKALEKKLYGGTVNNSKELSGFQQEIEQLGLLKGQLEDQILALMDEVDQYKSTIQQQKYLLAEQEKGVLDGAQHLQAQRAELEHALGDLRDKRPALEADVSGELLKKYDDMRKRKNGLAVVRVLRGTCGSCGMALAPQSRTKLQDGQLETCKNCGRMLVPEGD